MSNLKIVCTDQVPVSEPTTHAHIVAIGVDTDGDGNADAKHSKAKVIGNIRGKVHRYYTQGPVSKTVAYVEVVSCRRCGIDIIKSEPDATTDNNLDSLRRCNWRAS